MDSKTLKEKGQTFFKVWPFYENIMCYRFILLHDIALAARKISAINADIEV